MCHRTGHGMVPCSLLVTIVATYMFLHMYEEVSFTELALTPTCLRGSI